MLSDNRVHFRNGNRKFTLGNTVDMQLGLNFPNFIFEKRLMLTFTTSDK